MGRQLEASVHTALPPLVTGRLRGHLTVSFERGVDWQYSIGPPSPKLCVRLVWWGEKTTGTIFRVPVQGGSARPRPVDCTTSKAVYPIRSGWTQLKQYLKDMGSLRLDVGLGHMTDDSMVIGQASLPSLAHLSPDNPLSLATSITNPQGLHLGKLHLSMSVQLLKESVRRIEPPVVKLLPLLSEIEQPNHHENHSDQTIMPNKEGPVQQTTVQRVCGNETSVPEKLPQENVGRWKTRGLGPEQLKVVSELIDHGNRLRLEMVEALGHPVDHEEEDLLEDAPVIIPSDSSDDECVVYSDSEYSLLVDEVPDHQDSPSQPEPVESGTRATQPPKLVQTENTSTEQSSECVRTQENREDIGATSEQCPVGLTAGLEGSIVQALGVDGLTALGRVTRVRVAIQQLTVDKELVDSVLSQRTSQLATSAATSSTYFVEYQFPATLNSEANPSTQEVMRVASKKMEDQVVKFNHQSVFPVCYNRAVVQRWWNSTMIFRVYCKRPPHRMPLLVGKAVVALRSCLTDPHYNTELEVRSSTLPQALLDHMTDKDPLIGHLQVVIELVGMKKIPRPSKAFSPPSGGVTTLKLSEAKPNTLQVSSPPAKLQLLLSVPEAVDVIGPQGIDTLPNPFMVAKLFCVSPHPQSTVQWATHSPQFNFKQVYTVYLTPSLLEAVSNNFTVLEVWHRTPGLSTPDELVGLVKVSLHQFSLAYSDHSQLQEKLPVVAMDAYCPIVNPFNGESCGHLAVLCALGTTEQITALQQQLASGVYTLHKPHALLGRQAPLAAGLGGESGEPAGDQVLSVTVEGVRDQTMFNNTVWGETDCFVKYHFPSVDSRLEAHSTPTTLSVPSPAFNYTTQHTISSTKPLQQQLVSICGRGLSGGIPFELWRRYYYPNIRDQLIAKASLPVVKLCAVVTMSRGPSSQSFSLPLQLVGAGSRGRAGVLDVTVAYSPAKQDTEVSGLRQQGEETSHHDEEESVPAASDNSSTCSSQISADEAHIEATPPPPETTPPQEPSNEPPVDAFQARVIIHSALHLRADNDVFVSLHSHPNVGRVSTPVGPPAWEHHVITYVPNMYLQPQCPGLELQVWREGGADNECLGCACVDLSPLAFGLRQISGWYNITDFSGSVNGQLKVTVSPTERISYPSKLLSYNMESPPNSLVSRLSMVGRPGSVSCVSKTKSMLYKELRENIEELDTIHKSLQTRLGEIEKSPPFSLLQVAGTQTSPPSTAQIPVPTYNHTHSPTVDVQHFPSEVEPPATEYCSVGTQVMPVSLEASVDGSFHSSCSSIDCQELRSKASLMLNRSTEDPTTASEHSGHSSHCTSPSYVGTHEQQLNSDPPDLTNRLPEDELVTEPPNELVTEPPNKLVTGPPYELVTEPPYELVTEPPYELVTEPPNGEQLVDSPTEQLALDSPKSHDEQVINPIPSNNPTSSADNESLDSPSPEAIAEHLTINGSAPTEAPQMRPHSQPFLDNMPNFFMAPSQLEDSMRRLRSSALSRPRPLEPHPPPETPHQTTGLSTLQQVSKYLDSRRDQRIPSQRTQHSDTETQRIARIFRTTLSVADS